MKKDDIFYTAFGEYLVLDDVKDSKVTCKRTFSVTGNPIGSIHIYSINDPTIEGLGKHRKNN